VEVVEVEVAEVAEETAAHSLRPKLDRSCQLPLRTLLLSGKWRTNTPIRSSPAK